MSRIYLYNTGSYAKERLMSILVSDRIGCSPDFLGDMRAAIKRELDRYARVNEDDIDIQVREKTLIAHIPLGHTGTAEAGSGYTYRRTGQVLNDYDSCEEKGTTELKTVQS